MSCSECKHNTVLKCMKQHWSCGEKVHQERVRELRMLIYKGCGDYDPRIGVMTPEAAVEEDVVDSIVNWIEDDHSMRAVGELIRVYYPRRYV